MTAMPDPVQTPEARLDAAEEFAPATRLRLVLWAVAVTLLVASLGQTIVSTALPVITADLGGLDHITWVVTAYLLASTVGAPVCGKLGDLFGRKLVMQGALGVFTLGALICGVAPSMGVLIAGRAVQGLGGGGLIVVAMAVVADVLPPRQRARVQGWLGGVFGLSTIIGPLVGGFLVEQLSWQWIFYANIPVALLAFAVLQVALDTPARRGRVAIDYAGAALLAGFLSAAVLISSIGGSVLPWGGPEMLALIAATLAMLLGFFAVERRAPEPILPPSLFRINAFAVVNTVGFLVGMAMFGAITFLPLFLQVVKGASPTVSGLFLLPMMAGLLGGSIAAGQLMTRTGRYKLMPILSTALLALGMALLSQLGPETPLWLIALEMLITGLGIGPVMSVGVAAIQNAVPRPMVGVGTASANMFRLIGGSLGTSAFGAIFGAALARNLAGQMPGAEIGTISRDAVLALPAPARAAVLDGFAAALHPIFLGAAVIAVLASLISMLLRELPLADR